MTAAAPDVLAWAADALRDEGLTVQRIDVVGAGTEAVVRRLSSVAEDGRATAHVLKAFRRERRHNTVDSVRSEFEALAAFAATLDRSDSRVRCPRPLALAPDGFAYLMTYVDAPTLDDYLVCARSGSANVFGQLASAIVDGLVCFYDALGTCYADFQPRNICVSASRIFMLDPLIGNPAFLPKREHLRWWPASADVGFWTEQVGAEAVRQCIQEPRLAVARVSLTREVIRRAAEVFGIADPDGFHQEVVAVADFHFRRFRRLLGSRWTIHYLAGRYIARRCAQ